MNKSKIILFISLLLALLMVLFVIFTALNLKTQNNNITIYDDAIQKQNTQNTTQKQTNIYDDQYKITANANKIQDQNTFTDWQNSANIKQGKYVPQINTNTKTQEIIFADTQEQINTEPTYENENQYTPESPSDSDIWDWVPQTTPEKPVQETPKENTEITKIKSYTNTFGTEVKRAVQALGDQPKIMKNFMTNRGTPNNTREMILLSEQYTELGEKLINITNQSDVPQNMKEVGYTLARAYKNVGVATKQLAQKETTDDTKMLEAIYEYNKQIDAFATDFISFANLIGAYGIIFKKGEGGDIFTPPLQGEVWSP